MRQQQAGAGRALVRYFAAFEEGSLSPPDCQERIGMLKDADRGLPHRGAVTLVEQEQGYATISFTWRFPR